VSLDAQTADRASRLAPGFPGRHRSDLKVRVQWLYVYAERQLGAAGKQRALGQLAQLVTVRSGCQAVAVLPGGTSCARPHPESRSPRRQAPSFAAKGGGQRAAGCVLPKPVWLDTVHSGSRCWRRAAAWESGCPFIGNIGAGSRPFVPRRVAAAGRLGHVS
jgi:hypothetical protein